MHKYLAGKMTALMILSVTTILHAGEVDVVAIEIDNLGDNRYRIDVTLSHEDAGWDHYANKWDVINENGIVIGTRELAHPHVNEQPFTRSLTLTIPADVKTVMLRGFDSVHEDGGKTLSIAVPGH